MEPVKNILNHYLGFTKGLLKIINFQPILHALYISSTYKIYEFKVYLNMYRKEMKWLHIIFRDMFVKKNLMFLIIQQDRLVIYVWLEIIKPNYLNHLLEPPLYRYGMRWDDMTGVLTSLHLENNSVQGSTKEPYDMDSDELLFLLLLDRW